MRGNHMMQKQAQLHFVIDRYKGTRLSFTRLFPFDAGIDAHALSPSCLLYTSWSKNSSMGDSPKLDRISPQFSE